MGGELAGEESAVGWTLREGGAWKLVKFPNSSVSLKSYRAENQEWPGKLLGKLFLLLVFWLTDIGVDGDGYQEVLTS